MAAALCQPRSHTRLSTRAWANPQPGSESITPAVTSTEGQRETVRCVSALDPSLSLSTLTPSLRINLG
eukprot:2878197-Rhodomonas_salina.1